MNLSRFFTTIPFLKTIRYKKERERKGERDLFSFQIVNGKHNSLKTSFSKKKIEKKIVRDGTGFSQPDKS